MKVSMEIELEDFRFWGPANKNIQKLTPDEIKQLQEWLEELQDEWDYVALNDIVAYDVNDWLEYLGISETEWENR